jgi:hypothetical protein
MNKEIFERFTLPGLFTGMREVVKHNQKVIEEISWKPRGREKWNPMSLEPASGAYPNSFRILLTLPMYVSPYDIDYGWRAYIHVTFPWEYFKNTQGNGHVYVSPFFSGEPFHHHASGDGQYSRICVGNLPDVARLGKACNLVPMICALLNRDKMVCSMGGHLNTSAFEHWKNLGFRTISQITFFGADGNPITRSGQADSIRFRRI